MNIPFITFLIACFTKPEERRWDGRCKVNYVEFVDIVFRGNELSFSA